MKELITLIIFLTLGTLTFGQNEAYYYSPEGKVRLTLSTKKIIVKFVEGTSFEEQSHILKTEKNIVPLTADMQLPAPKVSLALLENNTTITELRQILTRLNQSDKVLYANPFYKYKDGTLQGITEYFLVRLKKPNDLPILRNLAQLYDINDIHQNEFDPQLYHLAINKNNENNALSIANELFETGLFDYAEPDFLRLMKKMTTNDPYVNNQWALNNSGSNTASYGGIADADMKIFDAWMYQTGSSAVKVAILDEGVDLNHPDLLPNLEPGYDATGQGSAGGHSSNDAHGTACAGIVAAAGNNGIGTAGVAYNCHIVPIRLAYSNNRGDWVSSNAWIGNAINWAWQNAGADVLSNSWGGGGSSFTINTAINNAVTNGRDGLGSPVLFAAGNDNGAVNYPANQNNTIAVAAMSMCNERKSPTSCDRENWWGSNYGEHVDVAAPGVKIYTTDVSGSSGYSSNSYISGFSGTSSATPNAAGVMALLLSSNGNLTEQQARYALESTCDKVGGYTYNTGVFGQPNGTWSNELGYGCINALAALMTVTPSSENDAGIMQIISPIEAICASEVSPVVTLRNNGSNTLNSVTINYQIDNGNIYTFNWTGTLSTMQIAQINLASIPVQTGIHILTVFTSNPNGQTDSNPSNDEASSSFSSGINQLSLSITLDNYGTETTWEIKDANGNTLVEGGPYQDNVMGTAITESICLPNACFDFIMKDEYGDGMCCGYGNGSYRLVNDATGATLASGGRFTDQQTTNFCIEGTTNEPLSIQVASKNDVLCFGGNNGSAAVIAKGGTPPYSFEWNHGATTAVASNLSVGVYTVTARDSDENTATTEMVIRQPSALVLNMIKSDAVDGNTGYAAAEVSGGTIPYYYAWSNGASSPGISGLSGGTYTVTVSDENACTQSASVNIEQISSTPLSVNISSLNDISCHNGQNGSATGQANGGSPPYSYSWSNGQNGSTATGLAAGSHTLSVSDSNGGLATVQVTINEPPALVLSMASTHAIDGNNGSANLSVNGGTPPYSYQWSNGATTQDINNLAGGTYSVTVTDNKGCSATESVFIETFNTPDLSLVIIATQDVSCKGGSNGRARGQASGGFPPYSYNWSSGQSGSLALGLAAGLHTLSVSDSNGGLVTVQVTINEPPALVLSMASTNAIDGNNGSANLSVNGGTPPYSYQWSNGATTQNITNLAGGEYSVSVSDSKNCTTSTSILIETITTPPTNNDIKFEHGLLTDVGEDWQNVSLNQHYNAMVVVASVRLPSANAKSVVSRIRNANGNSFEIKVQTPGGMTLQGHEVDYFVVEEGVYTEAIHGIKMEAVRAKASQTAASRFWSRENRSYENTYDAPVVLGQVMTFNNEEWSVFWASASNSRNQPPRHNSFAAGKHVGEDPIRERVEESIGYVVFEAGNHNINGIKFQTALGSDLIRGVSNLDYPSEFRYKIEGLVGASVAVISAAAIDGNNGGWPALFGTHPVSGSSLDLVFVEDQLKDEERSHTTEQAAYIIFEDENAVPNPNELHPLVFEQGIINGIAETWTTINLKNTYDKMVVVTTVVQENNRAEPVVVRLQNAEGNSFQLKVQSPGGLITQSYTIHYMVVEEGVYTEETHGINMEAKRVLSTQTSAKNIWKYEFQTYENSYIDPVVLGQVMSYNDERWSVFWANNGNRKKAPDGINLAIGKHVGEDSNTSRADETLAYIVFEAGVGHINGVTFAAGVSTDMVRGIDNSASGFQYHIPLFVFNGIGLLSVAGIDGSDCGWPVLFGPDPTTGESLQLAFDEDKMRDVERLHPTEQVAYIVFENLDSHTDFMVMPTPEKPALEEASSLLVSKPTTFSQLMNNNTPPSNALSIYPNPATELVHFKYEFATSGEAQIFVSNTMGKIVIQQNRTVVKGQSEPIQLNINDLNNGYYFLNIIIGKERLSEKFIKIGTH